MVNNLPAIWETRVPSLDRQDPLEKGTVTHSSILACSIPQRSLLSYSPWGHKELDATEALNTFTFHSSDGLYLSTELGAIKNYFCITGENKDCIGKIGQRVNIHCFSHSVMSDSLQPTPWTVTCQAPLFMEFSRQENRSGLPFPSPVNIYIYIVKCFGNHFKLLCPSPLGKVNFAKILLSYHK